MSMYVSLCRINLHAPDDGQPGDRARSISNLRRARVFMPTGSRHPPPARRLELGIHRQRRRPILPILSLVLVGLGDWFMGMRSLVPNVVIEDMATDGGGVHGKRR